MGAGLPGQVRGAVRVPALDVLAVGAAATIQDHGRRGYAAWGVGRAGAADLASHDLANRLVGNQPGAASIEALLGGLVLRARSPLVVAVTGADVSVGVEGRAHPTNTLLRLPAGAVLRLGQPRSGLRSYVAVRGGFDADVVLGSRSTDTLSGLGPAPLAPGQVVAVGGEAAAPSLIDHVPQRGTPPPAPLTLRCLWGPRADWFTPAARHTLLGVPWQVSGHADRVGVRLDGPQLERAVHRELPSEGAVLGSIQVTGSGPIVFLPDHPVTGGYPVIGVVTRGGVNALAQAVPGSEVRFVAQR